jgi:hypothetical protein
MRARVALGMTPNNNHDIENRAVIAHGAAAAARNRQCDTAYSSFTHIRAKTRSNVKEFAQRGVRLRNDFSFFAEATV